MRARHGTRRWSPVRDGVGTGWMGVGQANPCRSRSFFRWAPGDEPHARHGAPGSRSAAPVGGAGHSGAGSRATPVEGPRVCGVPHGPARGGRRADPSQAAAGAGARNRRHGGEGGRAGPRFRSRHSGGSAVAGLERWHVRLLPLRPGEPLRPGALHRLPARRGLRRLHGGGPPLLLPHPRGLPGPAGRAAAVRGAHRLPLPAHGREHAERLGLYGFGAAAHVIIQVARYQGRRVFGFTRPGDEAAQAVRAGAGGGVGGRTRTCCLPCRWTRPSSSLPWEGSCPPRWPPW